VGQSGSQVSPHSEVPALHPCTFYGNVKIGQPNSHAESDFIRTKAIKNTTPNMITHPIRSSGGVAGDTVNQGEGISLVALSLSSSTFARRCCRVCNAIIAPIATKMGTMSNVTPLKRFRAKLMSSIRKQLSSQSGSPDFGQMRIAHLAQRLCCPNRQVFVNLEFHLNALRRHSHHSLSRQLCTASRVSDG
jgi:hypothetical protein